MKHNARVATVAALLFGSGFCALIYEVGWLRELRLIFGASTAASAAVLAIFVGGLGAGGLLAGRRADAHPRPLLLYAQLEAVAAISSALSPWLLTLVRTLYIAMGGTARAGLAAGTIARLLLTALVLAIPTLAIGGTLPAAARDVSEEDPGRGTFAAIYALNTLGAVAGCLAATFFLVEAFGTRSTLWLTATLNALVALTAWWIDRRRASREIAPPRPTADSRSGGDRAGRAEPAWFVLLASAAAGAVFFMMELVWYRMLAPLLTGSVYTLGLIMAVALAGIGLGGLWYAIARRSVTPTLNALAWTCLLEALALMFPFALGDRVAILALTLHPLTQMGFPAAIASWTIVTILVVLPAAVAAGYQFPLLVALFGRGQEHLSREIGAVYASNTIGAIAGSLAGGFGLMPWLSAPGLWRFSASTLVALAAGAMLLSLRQGRRLVRGPLILSASAVVCLCVLAPAPSAVWRHSGIGAGRSQAGITSWNALREWSHSMRRAIVWDEDGTESSVALSVGPAGYAFIVNGKGDGSARMDAGTQVMMGLLGAILHQDVRRSLVIGLGTGSTAGWLGAVPEMERVDVVELEPLTIDVARACDEINREVLRNTKVHLTIGDAREALLTARDQYDLIASEPSNPYRAGVASLFTREYYQAASQRLTGVGVFLQWVQLYEINAETLETIYATIASVFPHVEAWESGGSDLVLVAAKRPLAHSAEALTTRIQQEPFRSAMLGAWRARDLQGLLAHFVANEQLTPLLAERHGVGINTDDRNIVEFGFARSVGAGESLLADLRALARGAGRERPIFTDSPAVNWDAVETGWVAYQSSEGQLTGVDAHGPPDERARQAALIRYYRDMDIAGARREWNLQSAPPSGPTELAMLADLEADAGSDAALGEIQQLRVFNAGEADTLLATLRFRQGRYDDAAAALEDAFETFRADPWALNQFKQRAVALAGAAATRSPQIAARMFRALSAPLALRAVQDERLALLATLTRRVGFETTCRDAVAALEPHVPWTLAFLTLRRDCYQVVNDTRAGAAMRDLRQLVAHEPASLKSGSDQ